MMLFVASSSSSSWSVLLPALLLLLPLLVQGDGHVVPVNYTHENVELQGFRSVPDGASMNNPVPALVIIPDWDGVNEYETMRAEMVAKELGYVGFAADIYGKDLHYVESFPVRIELAEMYRSNATLFTGRIQAAVDLVRTFDEVDSDNVAIMGYCFGGTGVLTYALTGVNDVKALVSFHGGLANLTDPGPEPVTPKVLVLSGGEDDTSTAIMDLEMTLDTAGADWEITRYSGVEHAFTVFSDRQYNEWADMRSWESMSDFLKDAFGQEPFEPTGPSESSTGLEAVPYTDVDGTELQGYLAMPGPEWKRPLPAVLILPNWDGVNTYEQQRATLLAEIGYVGFAADIYGANLQTNLTFNENFALSDMYRNNSMLYVQRIQRAIDEVKKYSEDVDQENIAVIGYCFGGTGVIELAFSGSTEVKVVVPFHGGLQTLPEAGVNITPYTLVLSGGIDDAHGNQTELEEALNAGNAEWEITRYSGVDHGFTSWTSGAYSVKADDRSWYSMLTSFESLMPVPCRDGDCPTPSPTVSPTTLAPVADPTSAPVLTAAPVVPTPKPTTMAPSTAPSIETDVDDSSTGRATVVEILALATAVSLVAILI